MEEDRGSIHGSVSASGIVAGGEHVDSVCGDVVHHELEPIGILLVDAGLGDSSRVSRGSFVHYFS